MPSSVSSCPIGVVDGAAEARGEAREERERGREVAVPSLNMSPFAVNPAVPSRCRRSSLPFAMHDSDNELTAKEGAEEESSAVEKWRSVVDGGLLKARRSTERQASSMSSYGIRRSVPYRSVVLQFRREKRTLLRRRGKAKSADADDVPHSASFYVNR